ncbi:MAG: AsmA family protein [Xanthomonadales bacterium]|nr:AsmA family protein [Xanthomonadales bacterium]NIX14221.1 AsmA family protein [Xanthomonadales bacterium]
MPAKTVKRLLKRAAILLLILAAGATILLFTMDLGFLRGTVEKRLSEATGRRFSIGEDFSMKLGGDLVIRASDVSMANAEWAGEDRLFTIDELRAVIDPWASWKGPVTINRVEIDGLEVSLQKDPAGQANWELDLPAGDSPDEDGGPPLLLHALTVSGADIVYSSPDLVRPVPMQIADLSHGIREDGMLQLSLDGRISDRPVSLSLTGGPWARLADGRDVSFEGNARFGSTTLSGSARLDDALAPVLPEFELELKGPDFNELTEMLGFGGLGDGNVSLRAAMAPMEGALEARVEGNLGQFRIEATGTAASFPEMGNASVLAALEGPNFGRITRLAGLDSWPDEPFRFDARWHRPGGALRLEAFRLSLGEFLVEMSGDLPEFPKLAGGDLEVSLGGPDLASLSSALGAEGLPEGGFSIEGSVRTADDGPTVIDVQYRIPLATGRVSGTLSSDGWSGTRLTVTGNGESASALGDWLGLGGLGIEPWSLDLPVTLTDPGVIEPSGARFETGGLLASLSGRINSADFTDGSDFRFSLEGESLSGFQALAGDGFALPAQPFTVGGHAVSEKGAWRLDGVTGHAGTTSFVLGGVLGAGPGLQGTNLRLELEGTDLGAVFDLPGQARMPDGPYTANASIELPDDRLVLNGVGIRAGAFGLEAEADIPWPPDLSRGRFSFSVKGVDITRVLPELAGLELDPYEYEVRAAGDWRSGTISISEGRARIGASTLTAEGSLDLPPNLSATDFRIGLQSPDLSRLGKVDGERWGTVPLDMSTTFTGTPTQFRMEGFRARLGDSEIRGVFGIDFEPEVPEFDLRFTTSLLNLKPFQVEPEVAEQEPDSGPKDRLLPDFEFPMEWLSRFNGNFAIAADRVLLRRVTLENNALTGEVRDGRLQVNELGTDGYGGRLVATLDLSPDEERTARLTTTLQSTGLVVDFTDQAPEDKAALPPFDIDIDLEGSGATLRDAAASLAGRVTINSPGGTVKNVSRTDTRSHLLAQVVSAISPSAARQDEINISCIAAVINAQAGVLRLDPGIALQSDKLNIFARGSVDLGSEKLDVNLRTQTRKTVDISISEVFSPYVKLSGTLAKPSVTIDPKGTLLSGGAAYLSGGLSILAKKALDQLGGTRDPCADFLSQAEAQKQKR